MACLLGLLLSTHCRTACRRKSIKWKAELIKDWWWNPVEGRYKKKRTEIVVYNASLQQSKDQVNAGSFVAISLLQLHIYTLRLNHSFVIAFIFLTLYFSALVKSESEKLYKYNSQPHRLFEWMNLFIRTYEWLRYWQNYQLICSPTLFHRSIRVFQANEHISGNNSNPFNYGSIILSSRESWPHEPKKRRGGGRKISIFANLPCLLIHEADPQ